MRPLLSPSGRPCALGHNRAPRRHLCTRIPFQKITVTRKRARAVCERAGVVMLAEITLVLGFCVPPVAAFCASVVFAAGTALAGSEAT